jgi:hypothetical protein
MGKEEIKIINKEDHKKFEDYTFIDNNIGLKKLDNENVSNLSPSISSSSSSSSSDEKYKEYVSKLRKNPKKDTKAREKSRLSGGHITQSHSPIYE